ncbi:hypothetical protein CBL_06599 [Carabus blaptoides fortunei]
MVLIRIHYGPVETNGIIRHKVGKVLGLAAGLRDQQYEVQLLPTAYLNRMVIEIVGYEVLRRSVKYLHFNVDYNSDKLCKQSIDKIKKAIQRFFPHYFKKCYPRITKKPLSARHE